jgi:SAM-dependent methyltransferase
LLELQPLTFFTGTTNISDQSNWEYLLCNNVPELFDKTILDVGCASGFFLKDLTRLGKLTIGIDIRDNSNISPTLNFIQADCHTLPFKDQSFDLVVSLGVLEHVADYEQAIIEMKRLLKPNGYLFLMMGTTPLWKYLDNPEHIKTITRHPDVFTVLKLLQDGHIKKLWGDNIQYRLFQMDSFILFPTSPLLLQIFKSLILKQILVFGLQFLEKCNLEQNMCLLYSKQHKELEE